MKEYKYQAYQQFAVSIKGIDDVDVCKVEMHYQTNSEMTEKEQIYQLLKALTQCINLIAIDL